MAGNNRLIELATELLIEIRTMRVDFEKHSERVSLTIQRLTLQTAENTLVFEELNLLILSLTNRLKEIASPKQSS